jgi:soluble lytic murein transglycosylase-like protein
MPLRARQTMVSPLLAGLAVLAMLSGAGSALATPLPLAVLEARAASADGAAMVELGLRLENAEGVKRDYAAAALLYCRAAAGGHADGAYHLGLMRLYGRGIAGDDTYAKSWLQRAASAGQKHASLLLAHLPGAAQPDGAICPSRMPAGVSPRPATAPKEIVAAVERLAPRYRLDPALVLAVIAVESNFQADAVSAKNARGLMQLIPATAIRFGVADSFDPVQNLQGGMGYLSWLLQLFEGDVTLATAAYNAGEGAVQSYGGVPPYKETQLYVARIRDYYQRRR